MDTTVSVPDYVVLRLNAASSKGCVPLPVLCAAIVRSMLKRFRRRGFFGAPVRYRRRRPNESELTPVHLHLSDAQYERCLDLRKLFKRSVSCCFVEEVEDNLDSIVNRLLLESSADNNDSFYAITAAVDLKRYHYTVKMKRGSP